jgi:ABC-type multidrug transport system ATPase subunit
LFLGGILFLTIDYFLGDISMFESFLRSALTNPEDIRALEQSGMHPVSFILRGAAEIDRLHAREWGVSESEWSRQLEVIAVYNDKSRSATSNSVSDGALIPNYSFGLERSTSGKANEVSLSLDRAPADQSQQPVPSSPEPAAHNDVPTLLLDPVVEEWVRPIRRLRNKICSPVPPILSIDSGRKLSVLFKRSFVVYSRSIFGAKLVILRSLILGIIVGILYYKSGENFDEDALVLDPVTKFNEESYNLFSLMYLICLVVVFMAGTSIPAYFEMHRVCEREIQNSWYHPFSSVLATMAVDTPILMASTVAFSAIVYRMTELRGPESWFYGGVAVLACVGYAQARFCVAVARHPLFAFMLFVVMWAFELMLSGAMIPESYILLWDWALDVNFSYWGVRLLENNEFKGFNEPYGDLLLNAFGFLYTDKIDCIAYMFVFFVIFTLIYLVALYPNPQRLISIPPGEFSRILISMLALDDCEDDSVQDSVDPSHRRSVRMVQLSTRTTNANSSSALTEPLTGDSSSYRNNDAAAPTNATPAPQAQPVRTSPAWTREAALRYAYDAGIALLKLLEMLVHINYDYSYRAVMLEHRTRPLDNVQTPRSETATSPAVSRLTLAPDRRVTIVFHKLSYALPSFKLQQGLSSLALRMMAKVSSKPVELVPVLKHVSGIAKSAELCLVLGVQGSGKGTLFEVLNEAFRCANRSDQAAPIERRGVQGGNIYVNGCLLQTRDGAGLAMSTHRASSIVGPMQNQPSWSSVSFVASDDTLNTMLTVREHLRYSLLLRRQNSIALSSAEELRSVDDLVQDLLVLHSLDRVQDSCVGLPQHRSLTQGQMRRLAIALGVSSGSSILFLAAPLADLPHECVRSVSACLQTLAFSGRTVICSATGMSGQDMKLYHRLLLIHNGYSLYSGRTQDFASFMEMRFSLIPRPKQSVADFALSLSRGELLSGIVDNRYEQQIQAGLIAPNISSSKDGQAFSSRNTLVGSLNAPVNTSVLTMLAAVDEEVVSRLNRSYSMAQPLDVRRSVFTDALPKSVSSRVGFFINELLTLLDRDSRSVLRRPYWIVVAARAAVLGLLVGT